jgi:predicted RNA binding protein YcfA (HicA-like mRNA interferase family)
MPRITPVHWKVLECIFVKDGFEYDRHSGDHRLYTKKGVLRPVVIPTYNAIDKDIIQSNMRTAVMSREDFLLLDEKGFPLVFLEAKREDKNPVDGKEQARKYAKSINVRYVILSNSNLHYFWDMESGNPTIITQFPTKERFKNWVGFSLKLLLLGAKKRLWYSLQVGLRSEHSL